GLVDRDRLVMRAEAVTVCVRIGEHARLQHLVRRIADAWNDVRRRERSLLDLSKIVVGVAVELQDTDLDRRIVRMRPDLGQVKRIVRGLLSVELWHDLNLDGPLRELAALDAAEQLFLIALARLGDNLLGFL